MNAEGKDATQDAVDRVNELEEELEVSGEAALRDDGLSRARAALHVWVDAMTGVVVTPALGRVTVIHADGVRSTISSPALPFAMSAPLARSTDAEG